MNFFACALFQSQTLHTHRHTQRKHAPGIKTCPILKRGNSPICAPFAISEAVHFAFHSAPPFVIGSGPTHTASSPICSRSKSTASHSRKSASACTQCVFRPTLMQRHRLFLPARSGLHIINTSLSLDTLRDSNHIRTASYPSIISIISFTISFTISFIGPKIHCIILCFLSFEVDCRYFTPVSACTQYVIRTKSTLLSPAEQHL